MTLRTPLYRRNDVVRAPSDTGSQNFPPERHTGLVRQRGGLISIPKRLTLPAPGNGGPQRLTKLLLNVTIQRSLGPVQVVMSHENSVTDLVKATLEIYVKEKRRPLLSETDPKRFDLHYSQFSLESLKPEDKLINLGSRNFFLCSKPYTTANSSCSEEAKMGTESPFPLTRFMDFLL